MHIDHGADPNVRIDWAEVRFDTIGGTTRNPPDLVLGRHLLTYNGATAFYVAATPTAKRCLYSFGEMPVWRLKMLRKNGTSS